jgi:hypothetical protein
MLRLLNRNKKYILYFIIAWSGYYYFGSYSNKQNSSIITGYVPDVKIIQFDQNDDLFLFLHIQKTGGNNFISF